jgi:hypothetical protein
MATSAGRSTGKVAVVRWPLSTERYLELIRNSDIGLLLYDADQYYARCSGVMVEMLKAGVPVIVPAGCWMADAIAEQIFAHRDRLCQTAPGVARMSPADAEWEMGGAAMLHLRRKDARPLVGGHQGRSLETSLSIPAGARYICIRFRFAASNLPGSYLEVSAKTTPELSRPTHCNREIVGMRASGEKSSVLIPLAGVAGDVKIAWRNAYGDRFLELEDVEFFFLSNGAGALPLGAVGLIAAGIDQAPALIRDMADHYPYYRRTAAEFAPTWGERHSPETVVRLLIESPTMQRRTAA